MGGGGSGGGGVWVGGRLGGVRVDVNKELKFLEKFKRKILGGRGGGQGECEQRIEVFGKIQKKMGVGAGGWGGGGGWGWVGVRGGWLGGMGGRVRGGGQGGCEQRIEVFGENSKIKKIFFLGGGGRGGGAGEEGRIRGGQGECERRIEVFGKIHKNNIGGGGSAGRGGLVWWGVRVDVIAMLGVGVMLFFFGGWGVRVDVNREVKFL